MSAAPEWHYTDKAGNQAGPISTDDLIQLILNKTVPMSSMAWKNGMPGWKPVSQISELHVSPSDLAKAAPAEKSAKLSNPTHSPAAESKHVPVPNTSIAPEAPILPTHDDFSYSAPTRYGGIGRLAYFLISIFVSIITNAATYILTGGKAFDPSLQADAANSAAAVGTSATVSMIMIGLSVFSLIITIYLACARFKNIGMSRWWVFSFIVPILNIFSGIWLVSRQEGWVEDRQLDTPGKIVAWTLWLTLILSLLVIVAATAYLFYYIQQPTPAAG